MSWPRNNACFDVWDFEWWRCVVSLGNLILISHLSHLTSIKNGAAANCSTCSNYLHALCCFPELNRRSMALAGPWRCLKWGDCSIQRFIRISSAVMINVLGAFDGFHGFRIRTGSDTPLV